MLLAASTHLAGGWARQGRWLLPATQALCRHICTSASHRISFLSSHRANWPRLKFTAFLRMVVPCTRHSLAEPEQIMRQTSKVLSCRQLPKWATAYLRARS